MTSAGSNAGTGQARQPADTGRGTPDPGQARQDAAAEQAGQGGQPAADRPAPPVLPEQSREDTDIAWGDYRGSDDEDRDRLFRDRPPHWADY
jgi:hypothetical protein